MFDLLYHYTCRLSSCCSTLIIDMPELIIQTNQQNMTLRDYEEAWDMRQTVWYSFKN